MKKKWIRILVLLIILTIIYGICDFFFALSNNRPLIAIKGEKDYMYKGLFFDTYNCPEYPIVQIKAKFSNYSCFENNVKVKEIVDKTKEMDDFACAEVLEQFYEDDDYKYYYSCMKGKYIIVRYENGDEETVAEALKKGNISIEDLDLYDINYYKY